MSATRITSPNVIRVEGVKPAVRRLRSNVLLVPTDHTASAPFGRRERYAVASPSGVWSQELLARVYESILLSTSSKIASKRDLVDRITSATSPTTSSVRGGVPLVALVGRGSSRSPLELAR